LINIVVVVTHACMHHLVCNFVFGISANKIAYKFK